MMSSLSTKEPIVSVCTLTYNQRDYIKSCLDGIISQKTNFPFEILIHDDCSTDGTREIVQEYAKRYPTLIKLLLPEENQYQKGVDMFSKCVAEAEGKYIAWCEGDDEWIDNEKLQLQYDYIEKHPECSLVYTNVDVYVEKDDKVVNAALTSGFLRAPKSFKEHLKIAGHLAPLTWLFRKDCFVPSNKRYVDWSYSIALDLFAKGEVHFIDKVTALYRIFNQSVSNSRTIHDLLKFGKGIIEIKEAYFKRYAALLTENEINDIRHYTYQRYLPSAMAIGDKHFLNQCARSFRDSRNWKYVLLCKVGQIPGVSMILRGLYRLRGRW